MASTRLTRQDRQVIARGLADGLAYAEIARRLGRATSSITREVQRHGGPANYGTDAAHWAALGRARPTGATGTVPRPVHGPGSRRPDGPPVPDERSGQHRRSTVELREYEHLLADALSGAGLAPGLARVLSCLLTADAGGRTAIEIADRLRVSRATVSRAVAGLEELALLRRDRDQRRERYVVDDDLWMRATLAGAAANARIVDVARNGAAALGVGSPAADRLERIARSLELINTALQRVLVQAGRMDPKVLAVAPEG